MKKGLRVTLGFLCALAIISCGSSNVTTFDLGGEGYFTMACSADFAPYETIATDEDGNQSVVGVDIEIAKAVARKAGKNLRVVNKGFDFLLSDLQSGKIDFSLSGFTPTEERKKIVDFSDAYAVDLEEANEQVAITRKADLEKFKNEEALNTSIRIGAQSGTIQATLAQEKAPNAHAMMMQNLTDLYHALNTGSIDALVAEGATARPRLNEYTNLAVAFAFDVAPEMTTFAAAVRKGDTEMLALINETIAELNAEGKISEWMKQYSE